MGLIRKWWHRYKVFVHGECVHPDCEEPALGSPAFDRCLPHEQERWWAAEERAKKRDFDRRADIVAEGIRRAKEPKDG
jgi:hypothetical protein